MTANHSRDILDDIGQLAKRVKDLEGAGSAAPPWQKYGPLWTAPTTNPSLGAGGTMAARYDRRGRTLNGTIYMQMGPATTFGSGKWNWSLPAPPNTASVAFNGTWWARIGGNEYTGVALIYNSTIYLPMGGGTANAVDATHPAAWTNGSELSIGYTCETTT